MNEGEQRAKGALERIRLTQRVNQLLEDGMGNFMKPGIWVKLAGGGKAWVAGKDYSGMQWVGEKTCGRLVKWYRSTLQAVAGPATEGIVGIWVEPAKPEEWETALLGLRMQNGLPEIHLGNMPFEDLKKFVGARVKIRMEADNG